MPPTASLSASLTELHRFGPVTGACLLYKDFIVANHLPFSDKKMNHVCGTVTEMCNGYQSVGRPISEYYFGYNDCQMLVHCAGPIRLIILTENTADPDQIGMAARQFLQANAAVLDQLDVTGLTERVKLPPPKKTAPSESRRAALVSVPDEVEEETPDAWLDFRQSLIQVLVQVLGSAQGTRLVDRVVKEHGYGKRLPLKVDFRSIARAVVEKIPNRSRRRSLQSAVDELIRHLHL